MAYELSLKAEEDMIQMYVEGAQNFGIPQAEKYYAGLEAVFEFLAETPNAARERTEIKPPVRVYPYESHIVIYLLKESGDIFILRIRHGREDWQSDPT